MTQYKTQYGTVFAVKEHNGSPAIMCRAEVSETWSLSSMITPFTPGAWTAEELQGQLDNWAATKGWQPVAEPASGEALEIVDECSDLDRPCPGDVYRSAKGGQLYKIGELTNGKKTCYLTMQCNVQGGIWVPANSSVYPNLSDAQGEFEAWIRREQLEPVAPTMDAAAIMDELAAKDPFKVEETSTVSPENSLDVSSCPSAEPARQAPAALPLSAPDTAPMSLPAFDFGADAETNAALLQDAQIFMAGSMARVMAAKRAHDRTANNYRGSWGKWCDLVGISRDTGDNMVRVAENFGNMELDGKPLIEAAPFSLLAVAAKPSAPAELVQAVKDGDITTHKQYQELLAKLKTEQAARKKAETDAAYYRTDSESARAAADDYHRKYEDANTRCNALLDQQTGYITAKQDAESRARAAENRAAGAQKLAEQRGSENTELKAKIRELENQPRDVAVVQPGEDQIQAWRREGADRMAATLQDTVRQANQEKLQAQNEVADLREQLATARPDADACQRTVDTLYETAENLRMLLRSQLKQAQLPPSTYGQVVAHVLLIAHALLDTVRLCAPDGYDMDSEEDDDFE